MKYFIPLIDEMLDQISPDDRLVPFSHDYRCLHWLEYEIFSVDSFENVKTEHDYRGIE